MTWCRQMGRTTPLYGGRALHGFFTSRNEKPPAGGFLSFKARASFYL
jgi:hypothetical protein